MLFIYPVGIPSTGALLLLRYKESIQTHLARREKLEADDGTQKVVTPKEAPNEIKSFQSLFRYFRPSCFWWGILELLYGLLLAGFAVLFDSGTMMQIVLAYLISFVYYVLQLTIKPYHNDYHNFMVALVNLNVVVAFYASMLVKVDNEVGGSSEYDSGYDIDSIATLLILTNVFIFVEFIGYVKRAVELATGVVIVATCKSDLAKEAENNVDNLNPDINMEAAVEDEAKTDATAAESSTTEENGDKAAESMASKMACAAKSALKSLSGKKKKEKNDSKDPASIVEGLYFPRVLNGHLWSPFPHTNTYQEMYILLLWCAHHIYARLFCKCWDAKQTPSDAEGVDAKVECDNEGADGNGLVDLKINNNAESGRHRGVTSWSPLWDVPVYVNDTSGWVLRRTSNGWEIAPTMSADANFIAKGATPYPPNSGWETVQPSSTVDISSISVPFRWQRKTTAKNTEFTADAVPSVFFNPGVLNTKRGSTGDECGLARALSKQEETSIELTQLPPT